MGGCIDLNLFTKTGPLAADEEEDSYGEVLLWKEAEDLRANGEGSAYRVVEDGAASGGKYLQTVNNITGAAPSDKANTLILHFDVQTADTYYIYARVNCPSWDDDSYWLKLDGSLGGDFENGLCTNGSWEWKKFYSGYLQTGSHYLTIAGREDGGCLDKFCITTNPEPPIGMGGSSSSTTTAVSSAGSHRLTAIADCYSLSGVRLVSPHSGPCIEVQRSDDGAILSRKIIVRP
jgi:hypothetical protein